MDNYLTAVQAAKKLGVSTRTVRRWCIQDRLPGAGIVETPAGLYWAIPEEGLRKPIRKRKGATEQ